MSSILKEKIKKDNSFINFFKIPEELIDEKIRAFSKKKPASILAN